MGNSELPMPVLATKQQKKEGHQQLKYKYTTQSIK